jgi:hypothetical protein
VNENENTHHLNLEEVLLDQRKLKRVVDESLEFGLELIFREVGRDLVHDHDMEKVLACGRRHRSGELSGAWERGGPFQRSF